MKQFDKKSINQVVKILKQEVKHFEDPSVTLVGKRWGDPYLVLISCLLSLRTKDETTLPAAERLFALAKTPKKMLTLTAKQIEKVIYPVGFFHVKTKNILSISKSLVDDYKGAVPDTIDELLTLKGVGRKTANLVVTEGFGKFGICVDTHVHRISNRLGFVSTSKADETEYELRNRLPKRHWLAYNCLLVLWGQNICAPVSPKCSQCKVQPHCCQVGVMKHR